MVLAVNDDAQTAITTAFEIGIPTPRVSFRGQEKPGVKYELLDNKILIECIDGPRCTFSQYIGGRFRVVTINNRELLTGGQGPRQLENLVTMFPGSFDCVEKYIGKLEKLIRKHDPEYGGFINLEVIFSKDDGKPYFRSLRLGATVDFLYCLCALYGVDDDIDVLFSTENAPTGVVCSARVHAYPYDPAANLSLGLPLRKGDESYVAVGKGENVKGAWKNLYAGLDDVSACFRTDGFDATRRIYAELKRQSHV